MFRSIVRHLASFPVRGLRQGDRDPQSSFLFVMAMGGLSGRLKIGQVNNRLRRLKVNEGDYLEWVSPT